MNAINIAYKTTGITTPVAVDWRITPFAVAYAIIPVGTTAFSLTIDLTLDDVNGEISPGTPSWISGPPITEQAAGTLTMPFQFLRLNITALTGSNASILLKLLQPTQL